MMTFQEKSSAEPPAKYRPVDSPCVWVMEEGICLAQWQHFAISIFHQPSQAYHTVIYEDILWNVLETHSYASMFVLLSGVPVPSATERQFMLRSLRYLGASVVSTSYVLRGGGHHLRAQRGWAQTTHHLAQTPRLLISPSIREACHWQAEMLCGAGLESVDGNELCRVIDRLNQHSLNQG